MTMKVKALIDGVTNHGRKYSEGEIFLMEDDLVAVHILPHPPRVTVPQVEDLGEASESDKEAGANGAVIKEGV